MSKSISQAIAAAAIGSAPIPQADAQASIKGLFMLFHSWYGNLLLSRYTTGEVGADGKDKGIKSAMAVWQSELNTFDGDTVRSAADRCKTDHPKYPPTLPEFAAICRAIQPRRRSSDSQPAIEMSGELKSSYTARARAQAMAAYRAKVLSDVGAQPVPDGVSGLHQLVARAVSLAGGDEASALRKMESA